MILDLLINNQPQTFKYLLENSNAIIKEKKRLHKMTILLLEAITLKVLITYL
jgi:hypothetical protein